MVARPSTTAPVLGAEIAAARPYRAHTKADNTIRAYVSDWGQFYARYDARGLATLLACGRSGGPFFHLAQAGKADSTIGRHLAPIGWQHRQQGHVLPTARDARMVIADTLADRDPARGRAIAHRAARLPSRRRN